MYLRISRLRFVVIRCCFLLIILLFLLEIRIFFNDEISSYKNPMEILFWQKFLLQDKSLTNEEKIEQIESIDKRRKKNILNWTNIFYDIYQRKLEKLNQRDITNAYKHINIDNSPNISQKIFEIFEETPVRNIFCLKIKFTFFFRCFNVLNFVPQSVYFIDNVHIPIVNGVVKPLR
jgi:hypothetical protein